MTALFVTSTGTGAGKTWVTRGLARGARARGLDVVAIKPIETGCAPAPLDALALERACGCPGIANAAGLYRVAPPLSPRGAALQGAPALDFDVVVSATQAIASAARFAIVEGAGGVLVPLDPRHTIADLVVSLGAVAVLVAPNELGVLSYACTALESLRARSIEVVALALVDPRHPDASVRTNGLILAGHAPVVHVPHVADDDDDALAAATSPLLDLVLTRTLRSP